MAGRGYLKHWDGFKGHKVQTVPRRSSNPSLSMALLRETIVHGNIYFPLRSYPDYLYNHLLCIIDYLTRCMYTPSISGGGLDEVFLVQHERHSLPLMYSLRGDIFKPWV